MGEKQLRIDLSGRKRALWADASFDKISPDAKQRALTNVTTPATWIDRYLNAGANLDILRQAHDSLSSLAPGIHRWGSFCDLLQAPYSHPTDEMVLRWSAVFPPGRTLAMYVSHIAKACRLRGSAFPGGPLPSTARLRDSRLLQIGVLNSRTI